jgi:Ca2+-transporting ATPase
MEKGDPDIMKRPPRPTKEPVINKDMLVGIVAIPIADVIAVLGAFVWALNRSPGDIMTAQTVAFATLICSELLRAYTSRSENFSVFATNPFSNRWLVMATGLDPAHVWTQSRELPEVAPQTFKDYCMGRGK